MNYGYNLSLSANALHISIKYFKTVFSQRQTYFQRSGLFLHELVCEEPLQLLSEHEQHLCNWYLDVQCKVSKGHKA